MLLGSSIQTFIIVSQSYLVSYGDVAFPALFQRQAKCECICLQCQAQPRCLPPAKHPGSHHGLACSRMAAARNILVIAYCLKFVSTEKRLETSQVYPSLAFSLPERGVPLRTARGGRPGQARPGHSAGPATRPLPPDPIFSEEEPTFSQPSPTHQTPSRSRQAWPRPAGLGPASPKASRPPGLAWNGALGRAGEAPGGAGLARAGCKTLQPGSYNTNVCRCMKWCFTGLRVATYPGCLCFF